MIQYMPKFELEETKWQGYPSSKAPHSTNKEISPEHRKLVITIEDIDVFAQTWADCFVDIPDTVCYLAPLKDSYEYSDKRNAAQLKKFFNAFTDGDLSQIIFLVADQFYNDSTLRSMTAEFIERVRSVNPTAWILETSGDPRGQIYPGSNAVKDPRVFGGDITDIVRSSGDTATIRLNALQFFIYKEFMLAHEMENAQYKKTDEMTVIIYGSEEHKIFSDLRAHELFNAGISIIGITRNELEDIFEKLSREQRRLLLHHSWNLLGHLRKGSSAESYGGTVARLLMLLDAYRAH